MSAWSIALIAVITNNIFLLFIFAIINSSGSDKH